MIDLQKIQPDTLHYAWPLLRTFSFFLGGFALAFAATPVFTYFAYKYRWWKQVKDTAITGEKAPVFHKLHAGKHRRHIPTMAGILIWGSVAVITLLFNLSRAQTYLPLATLVVMGILGLFDDIANVRSSGGRAGVSARAKMLLLIAFSALAAWWFYYKLEFSSIHIPAVGNFDIGLWYIPLFMLVIISTANAVNITDGLDGLSGGTLSAAFAAYALIAFFQGNLGISAFCVTVVGALLAYTWFNIYPARFFMGDTGALALGATLGVVALLTNSVAVLPIIGFVFVIEAGSSLLQIFSKKVWHRKIFLSAPLHHHLEAIGWPETKVTMRLWIIGALSSALGAIIGLLGRG